MDVMRVVRKNKRLLDTPVPAPNTPKITNFDRVLDTIKESDGLLTFTEIANNAKIRGEQLMNHFKSIQNDFPDKIKEVRGKGLLTAFEMFDSKHLDGHTVSVELLNNGIYAKETHHSTVRIAPALTIKAEYIDQIAAGVRKVIKNL